ncbi:unnamed protein product [Spirodela intermedia]|uniref:Uncharacterized protein n=1 Tax=Spirodela intermedia TaxID=51605 RepID=A0A7I8KUA1_SPIIN|nr:unnamed protein product [Spirodela intermedia]
MTFIIFYHLSPNTYLIYFIYIIRLTLLDFYEVKSSWKRDYLEHIKIVTDQASLGLGLVHNKILVVRVLASGGRLVSPSTLFSMAVGRRTTQCRPTSRSQHQWTSGKEMVGH